MDAAATDVGRRDLRLLGQNTRRQLFRTHFQAEKADNAAIDGLGMAVGSDIAPPGLGDIIGDIGDERGLAHGRAAGEDDQVRTLQPAHLPVEIVQVRGHAREPAIALEGFAGHLDRGIECGAKGLEAAVITALFRQLEQLALDLFDLLDRRHLDIAVIGDRDHFLAHHDQVAPDGEVIDGLAIISGVEHRRRLRRQAREVLHHGDIGQQLVGQVGLERCRFRRLAGADDLAGQLIDRLGA